jgi:hypothetical protein
MTDRKGSLPPAVPLATALAALALSLPAALPAAADLDRPGPRTVLIVETLVQFANGERISSQRRFGPAELSAADFPNGDFVTARSRPASTQHWMPSTKVKFGATELARDQKKDLRPILKLFNKQRGSSRAPSHTLTNAKHDIRPENQFASFSAYITQFFFDNRNSVIMDDLDEFIDTLSGRFLDPVPASLAALPIDVFTTRFLFAQLTQQGNRLVGTPWIVEADVYLDKDIFAGGGSFPLEPLLVAGFLFASGYDQSSWADDLIGSPNPLVSAAAFDNLSSDLWKKNQARDQFYYDELTAVPAASSPSSAPGRRSSRASSPLSPAARRR